MTTLARFGVRSATASDHGRMLAALTLAFADDPAVRWLYPDHHRYLTYFPRFAAAFGGRAIQLGTALRDEDHVGAALWLPPGEDSDINELMALLEESVYPEDQVEVLMLLGQMSAHRPTAPHWYLPLIGVEPAQQGYGIGSALLRPVLSECDRDGLPAYLEATNPRNVALYLRHGFEVAAVLQAGSSPPISAMLRIP